MEVVDATQINTFAHVAQQADVSPSEEPIFVLSSSQLQEIISQGVQEATKPLNSKIDALEDRIIRQDEKIAALESTQDLHAENDLNQLRLIADLRKATKNASTETTKNRQEVLHALLAANNSKMLARDARKKMRIPKSSFCELLKTCDFIEKRSYYLDPRQDVLELKQRS